MADKQLRLVLVGDATSVQKALASMDASLGTSDAKVKGFGTSFVKMGLALEAGRMALQLFQRAAVGAISAVTDYNLKVEQSEKIILGVTKSQTALAEAQAIARKEEEAGHNTYQATIAALSEVIPLAQRYGGNLQDLVQVQQLLAAADPEQGLVGAAVALHEALSGNFLSLERRFEIPKEAIQRLKDEGVPNLEIVRRALADLGYDQNFLAIANDNSAKKVEIFKGKLTALFAEVEKPAIPALIASVEKLGHLLTSVGLGESFIHLMAKDLQAITTGHFLDQWAVTIGQVLFLFADASNKFAKTLTFGKVQVFSDEYLRNLHDNIVAAQGKIDADIDQHIAQPIADGLSGNTSGSPIAPAKLAAYGRGVMESYLLGLTGSDLTGAQGFIKDINDTLGDLFKDAAGEADPDKLGAANDALAQGLKEVGEQGHISADTFYQLTAIYGDQAINVAALINQYGAMVVAQDRATASAKSLADEKERDARTIAQLTQRLIPYQQALDATAAAEQAHADAAAEAEEVLQDRQKTLGKEAAEVARRDAAAVQAAQDAASAHAAANQEREAQAQQELTDIQERRKQSADDLYNSIVAGEQRALDAANHRVNALSAKGHKEDLDLLRQIQAAQDAGEPKQAAALRRQLEAQRKRRQGAEELASAEQQVAQDEFNDADAKAKAEVARQDAAAAKDEDAAKARLAAIQQEAKDQAAADAAAVKGAQDAAAADAERYRKQQQGIQDEIDGIQDAAREQAKKDKQARDDAQKNYDQQKAINDKIAIQLGGITHWEEVRAGHAQDTATSTKDQYTTSKDLLPIAQALADAAEREAAAKAAGIAAGGGARGGGTDERAGTSQASGGPTPEEQEAARRASAIASWLGYYGPVGFGPAMSRDYTPPGYHVEDRNGGVFWVKDGFMLDGSGTVLLPTTTPVPPPGNGGQPTAGGRGGSEYLRADGAAPGATPPGGWNITLNIVANNLTNLGDAQQQRALSASVGDAARREWERLVRGGA